MPSELDIKRFWSYVDIRSEDECWPWTGSLDKNGYGKFWFIDGLIGAHNFSLQLKLDRPIDFYSETLHKCNNRICQNPKHLEEGTHTENMKGVIYPDRKGENNGHAKLTNAQILSIKTTYLDSNRSLVAAKEIAEQFGISWQHVRKIVYWRK